MSLSAQICISYWVKLYHYQILPIHLMVRESPPITSAVDGRATLARGGSSFFGPRGRCGGKASKQDGKPLLREMGVVGQDVGDAFLTHGLHGNAICQAVAFVRGGFHRGPEPDRNDWCDWGTIRIIRI